MPRQRSNLDEGYVRDKYGNQIYPARKKNVFARDETFKEFYARDNRGNETYPIRNGKSLTIEVEGRVKIANFWDGTERYPKDSLGNEYYLVRDGKPFLLRDKEGQPYLAKNRKGISLIPWNYLMDYVKDGSPYFFCKDSAGNGVYVLGSELPRGLQMLCDCICRMTYTQPAMPCCLQCLG